MCAYVRYHFRSSADSSLQIGLRVRACFSIMLPQQKSKGKKGKKATQPPPPSMRTATASSSNSTTTERKNFNPKALEFIPGSGSHGPLWFGPSCLPANMVVSVGMPAPKGVAAMWNLDHSYTEESLRADLLEVDFEPEQITSYGANKGALRACARKDIRGNSIGHSIGSHRP